MSSFFSRLFGCRHKKLSDPFTPKRSGGYERHPAAVFTGTYRVCLDCGFELPYSLSEMKIVKRKHLKPAKEDTDMRARS